MRVPLTVSDFLYRAEAACADRTAVIDEPAQPAAVVPKASFSSFGGRVRAWQAGLDGLGLDVGDRVAVVSQNSARLLELLHAVPGSGRILVPINFRLSAAEIEYIVGHSGASAVLYDPELSDAVAPLGIKHRYELGKVTDENVMRFGDEPRPWDAADEDATATINYTSGTTARPKGVQLTHRNLWINAVTFAMHTRAWEGDVYLHTLPMFHCNGWGMPFALAGLGAAQVILRKVDGAEILRRVDRHGVTLMCGAPAVWNAVLDAAESWDGEIPGRDRVRVVCAGAPPPSRTIARIRADLGWEFLQIYGLTETSPVLAFNRSHPEDIGLSGEEHARRLSRAGAPAVGVRIRISEAGEVLARSNVIMDGYWNDDAATDAAMEDGWFRTGDGGTIDADGYLSISDRKKDVIISGGENVSSIEVEDCLFSHPAVAEVAVIGVPDEKWGETIKALVVLAVGAHATEDEMIEHCKARLARYKAPTSVEFRDEIPRTATGKIQKFLLREPYWTGHTRGVN